MVEKTDEEDFATLLACEKAIKAAKTKEDVVKVLEDYTSALGYKKICRMLRGKDAQTLWDTRKT